jgi:hypothetical protein
VEHRLIQGGEQFLPFARSRIKALRATGLQHASQQFEIDGVSIKARIDGEHDYITLSGGVSILSGVVQGGTIVSAPPPGSPPGTASVPSLSKFKPTTQCYKLALGSDPAKSPNTYNYEPKLSTLRDSSITTASYFGHTTSQHGDLRASMYSGIMAKVVQFLVGLGRTKVNPADVVVKYNWQFSVCHGVILDPDKKPWLVEISAARGVIAMKLPMLAGKKTGSDALREMVKLIGGIPTGETFPASITAGLAAGTIFQLISVAGMSAFFGKTSYSDDMGWSFDDTGSEAHNTCLGVISGANGGYHYKLGFTFAQNPDKTYTPSASLTQVSANKLSHAPSFSFFDRTNVSGSGTGNTSLSANALADAESPTLLACHINGQLVLVQNLDGKGSVLSSVTTGSGTIPIPATYFPGHDPANPPVQILVPAHISFNQTAVTEPTYGLRITGTEFSTPETTSIFDQNPVITNELDYFQVDAATTIQPVWALAGWWCSGCRDGFRIVARTASVGISRTSSYIGSTYPGGPQTFPTYPADTTADNRYFTGIVFREQLVPYKSALYSVAPTLTDGWAGITPRPQYDIVYSTFGATPQMVHTEWDGANYATHTTGALADAASYTPNYYSYVGYTT